MNIDRPEKPPRNNLKKIDSDLWYRTATWIVKKELPPKNPDPTTEIRTGPVISSSPKDPLEIGLYCVIFLVAAFLITIAVILVNHEL